MTSLSKLLFTSVGVLAIGAAHAGAALIPINAVGGVYNTGVDASGTVLPYGSTDTHYIIASSPDGGPLPEKTMDSSGGFPIGPWLGDDTLSRWDSESSDGHGGEGTGIFHNVTTFTSPSAGTVTITGQWSTDDSGIDITVNGTSTGNTAGGFQAWYPFSISEPVTAGVNTLDFVQGQGGTPGGFRVEFSSASVTPEPASLSLLGLGGLSLLARRRRA